MKVLAVISAFVLSMMGLYLLCYYDHSRTVKIKSFVIALLLFASGISGVAFAFMPDSGTREVIEARRADNKKALKDLKGQQFIDFSGTSPDGSEVRLSDFVGKGKYVLIDFWASWCGPCKASVPTIRMANEKYSGKGLEIISVNCWDKKEDALKEIKKGKMTWSVIITEESSATSLYHVSGIPSCFLIDADGKIVEAGFHPMTLPDLLKQYFDHE